MRTTKRAREHIQELSRFVGNRRLLLRGRFNDADVQDCLRYGWITWDRESNRYSVEKLTKTGRAALGE